ncbi:MAG: hypothetical protein ABSD63_05175 [Candidatus Korobacteraceae bacterium]|jgi:trehalose-6-phosphate synthase
MSRKVSELLKKALALPEEERAALARSLLKSLEPTDAFIESMRGSLAQRGMPSELERDVGREFS